MMMISSSILRTVWRIYAAGKIPDRHEMAAAQLLGE